VPLRLTIVQPTLAAYRGPVFARLDRERDIDLHLVYASTPTLKNVEPVGFRGSFHPMTIRHFRGHPFYWQQAQLDLATPAECDVLMLNWDVHYLSLVPALMKARRNGVGTVLWGHGYSSHTGALRSAPRRMLARLADACVFYNFRGRSMYVDAGLDPAKLFVAPNSIDSARATLDDSRIASLRALGASPNVPTALFIARLSPERKVEQLIEATESVLQTGRAMQLVIIGDGSAAPALRSLVAARGLSDRVFFTGALYDESSLAPWFDLARLVVLPSYTGLSLLHAFCYGRAVLTSDALDASMPESEALVPGVNGALFRSGDVADLARKMSELLFDEPRCHAMGAAARKTVDQTYNLDRMVDGLASAARYAFACR
jgi:glycosyltransferase involved in cell wall biosynthesis